MIAQILPQLIVDLLPTSEAVSMIINEFLSPQQVHMKSAAAMLVEVCIVLLWQPDHCMLHRYSSTSIALETLM